MFTTRIIAGVASAVVMLYQGAAVAQTYPTKPVRIVASGPGGGSDFAARLVAFGMTDGMGQPVIVENRPSGFIPAETVSRAAPDGYTLLLSTGILWILSLLHDKVPYDPVKDFVPITTALSFPNILVVHPSLPVKSVKDLIGLAKARPGQLNYATTGSGSAGHLAAELMSNLGGVNIVRIYYKSGGMLNSDLISGQIQMSFISAGSISGHIKAGRVKALAVTSAKPSAIFPELPTMGSTIPGSDVESIYAVFAPAKTPTAIINRLQQEITKAVHRADVKEKLLASGVEPIGSTPDALEALRKSEIVRMGKVIRDAGIRAE